MTPFLSVYLGVWLCLCAAGLVFLVADRRRLALFEAAYWRFLCPGWKLATFGLAAAGLVLIAPYTGDHTWDYWDAAFMSLLTFTTAPWAVGTLYRGVLGRLPARQIFPAAVVWMFATSWSYDLYILLRDGVYPMTCWSNIVLSSMLYAGGGLLWSLDWSEGQGVFFAFTRPDWPRLSDRRAFGRIFWYALPFMLGAAAMMLPFFVRCG
ncbi:MAG: hypothetical protein JXR96_03560 [Deltaproteobacteria bacterium]|nr:hypothetical protein [Deltaproteobacteria bacterium]